MYYLDLLFLLNTRPVVKLLESSLSLRKFYSTKYNPDPVVPILKYDNADLSKKKQKTKNKIRHYNANINCLTKNSTQCEGNKTMDEVD